MNRVNNNNIVNNIDRPEPNGGGGGISSGILSNINFLKKLQSSQAALKSPVRTSTINFQQSSFNIRFSSITENFLVC